MPEASIYEFYVRAMTEAQRRALGLLVCHNGACCVEKGGEMHLTFKPFADIGLVHLSDVPLMGGAKQMVNVYIFSWEPKLASKES